jgi:threonine dehydrogenase-like Zn-dependent dehydrogenase
LCMGPHRSVQQCEARHAVPLPAGLAPENALLARLMGVSMTTLMTTTARPGDRVMICGAGPVGFLAAQLFKLSGYDVIVIEPDEGRRREIERSGLNQTFARVPIDDPKVAGSVALVVDCSGHEQSVLDACAVVRQRGEVVLVGVPWRRQTEVYAHALLDLVFRNYVVLRSGWEWEIPLHSRAFKWEELLEGYNNAPQSIFSGFGKALRWLAEGRIAGVDQIVSVDPRDPASVYGDLMNRRTKALFVAFDWSLLGATA